ncbi:hypothetical protein ACJJTC_009698, partial [Scirpophaga incertulas]
MDIVSMEVREAGDGAASAGEYVRAAFCEKISEWKNKNIFLRTPPNGWEITLLYSDVTPSLQSNDTRLEWKPLIESNVALGVSSSKWSREEQLLLERQRVAAWGIGISPPLVPRSLSTGGGAALTPAMCPRASSLVAHAARGDVWLAGAPRRPTRLTYACKGHDPDRLTDDPKQAGVPCYVTQEEFSRYTGFWWQPKCDDDVFRIVYEEVDESDVKVFSFPSSQSSTGEVEEFRFPRAGTPNAKSTLKMVTFRLQKVSPTTVVDYYHEGAMDATMTDNESTEVTDIRWFELKNSLKEIFPWFEYLARVGWTPCGKYVWVQLLDRKQQRLELVLLSLRQFCAPFVYERAPAHLSSGPIANDLDEKLDDVQVLISESAPDAWINVHDILHFLPSQRDEISFIWASEETSHLHLYKVTCSITCKMDRVRSVMDMIAEDDSNAIGPNIISKEAITAGEWEVMPRKIWVDEDRKLVYFVGLRETPLERHLYVASYSPPAATCCDTAHYGWPFECGLAVITSSNISTVPSTKVYRIVHEGGTRLLPQGVLMEKQLPEFPDGQSFGCNGSWDGRSEDEAECSDASLLIREHQTCSSRVARAQILSTRLSCGAPAYCTLWRCANSGRSPTVLHVYGGPEVQTVTNCYKGIRQLRMHMLAARGFNVVSVDSRGSKHRGRAWEAAIKGKMGQVELDDQVEVLQWLAKETGCIDMERIAIHGWSYGGYLSLLGLATRPNIFKVCVAGAPVTSWRLYDTAYTERYMGLPSSAPHSYTRASVLAHAPFFPDQEGRLLIIHGLADENVHFCHTAALLAELVRLGKPHRVQ